MSSVQKCDAKRPYCSTCKATNKQHQCMYEFDAQKNLIQSLLARTRELEERLASTSRQSPAESTSSGESGVLAATTSGSSSAEALQHVWIPPPEPIDRPMTPRATLQQFREFRQLFLNFSCIVGLKLNDHAQRAYLDGDFFSPHVHPAIIHVGHLLGCSVWQERNFTDSLSVMETFELDSTVNLLSEDTDPLVRLPVYTALVLYFTIRFQPMQAMENLALANELVHRHNIRFTTSDIRIWDPLITDSEEVEGHEATVCALGGFWYHALSLNMVYGAPLHLRSGEEDEFLSVQVMHPALFRSQTALLRARAVFLLRRSQRLAASLSTAPTTPWSAPEQPSEWSYEYWAALEETHALLGHLQSILVRASIPVDGIVATLGLKMSTIVALTAEAVLHHLAPPAEAVSREMCLAAVLKTVGIGKTLSASDYRMIDPLAGLCWIETASIAFEESAMSTERLCATNWATARAVLVGCVPALQKAVPYLGEHVRCWLGADALGQITSSNHLFNQQARGPRDVRGKGV
ncbi:uncharacterized protein BXZ73DRAFT_91397 [Epithele typhae]|uniref:uncharacterized protein n=1 Tax=Epithele typhae TaxID=378194 RepID=UPI00200829FF|nr:uncharacterized protein BXZ73DRAFT_91397 [Epithele typhae]KAH9923701.1 hypothetical protein BXZ73DRAFT_91397 [Epithele typhae]